MLQPLAGEQSAHSPEASDKTDPKIVALGDDEVEDADSLIVETVLDESDKTDPRIPAPLSDEDFEAVPANDPPAEEPTDKTDPSITAPAELLDEQPGTPPAVEEDATLEDSTSTLAVGGGRVGRRVGLPLGSMMLVLAYVAGSGSCLLYQHRLSDEARIRNHLAAGSALLGEHRGIASSEEELIEAAEHFLQVLTLDRQLNQAHQRMEIIQRRLEQRDSRLPDELAKQYRTLIARARLERGERRGMFSQFPVSPTERFGLDEPLARLQRSRSLFADGFLALLGLVAICAVLHRLRSRESRSLQELDELHKQRTDTS